MASSCSSPCMGMQQLSLAESMPLPSYYSPYQPVVPILSPSRRSLSIFETLPVELLLVIFEHVDAFEPLERQRARCALSGTCQLLHNLIKPSLFEAPLLKDDKQYKAFIQSVLFSHRRASALSPRSSPSPASCSILSPKKRTLSNTQFASPGEADLDDDVSRRHVSAGQFVRTLDLSGIASRWFTVQQSPFCSLLPALPLLNTLNLSLCGSLDGSTLSSIAEHCPELKTLNAAYIDMIGPSTMGNFLQRMPRLTSLDVSYNERILLDPEQRWRTWSENRTLSIQCHLPDHESDTLFASIFLMGYQGLSTSRDVSSSFGWAVDSTWGRSRAASAAGHDEARLSPVVDCVRPKAIHAI